jgi:hypothetical protein
MKAVERWIHVKYCDVPRVLLAGLSQPVHGLVSVSKPRVNQCDGIRGHKLPALQLLIDDYII